MKNILLTSVAILALLFGSCRKNEGSARVKVHVNDCEITQEEFNTKDGVPVADYNTIKAITLAFYKSDGTEQYKVTQLKSNTSTFGEFDLSLPMGTYTMVVLGYGVIDGCDLVLTSPTSATFTGGHAPETFAATQTLNVTTTADVDISATLCRIISKLQVISTDGKTSNASKMQMTLSGGSRSFSPTTGLATDNNGLVNTVNISASEGDPSTSTTYLFVYSDPQTVTVTIDVLNSDGQSISQKVVNNVPLKRNRNTILSGSLYEASSSSAFTVNTTWIYDTTITF